MSKRLTLEDFILRASVVHNNIYDYSFVEYKGVKHKILIQCPTHGLFEQLVGDHIRGAGCSICGGTKKKTFIKDISASDLYHQTLERERLIKEQGYNLITVWEKEYRELR